MPIYSYYCKNCNIIFNILHSFKDKEEKRCIGCSGSLEKKYNNFFVKQETNIGKITKEFIEQSKKDLEIQKKDLIK